MTHACNVFSRKSQLDSRVHIRARLNSPHEPEAVLLAESP